MWMVEGRGDESKEKQKAVGDEEMMKGSVLMRALAGRTGWYHLN